MGWFLFSFIVGSCRRSIRVFRTKQLRLHWSIREHVLVRASNMASRNFLVPTALLSKTDGVTVLNLFFVDFWELRLVMLRNLLVFLTLHSLSCETIQKSVPQVNISGVILALTWSISFSHPLIDSLMNGLILTDTVMRYFFALICGMLQSEYLSTFNCFEDIKIFNATTFDYCWLNSFNL